jgi:hypothetical protein
MGGLVSYELLLGGAHLDVKERVWIVQCGRVKVCRRGEFVQ